MARLDRDPLSHPVSLVDVLRWRAEMQPDRVAYIWLRDGDEVHAELSYRELDRRARAVAATLQDSTRPGDRALLLYPPGFEFITAFFACLYAGVVSVPAYPPQPRRRNQSLERTRTIARTTSPVVLTSSRIFASRATLIAEAPELAALRWIDSEGISAGFADSWVEPAIRESSLALIQFTSGSTGIPKGCMISHGNIMSNLEVIRTFFGCHSDSCGLTWLPPYHDMGLIGGILEPVFAGFPVVLMSPISFLQHPIRWLRALSRFEATMSGGPNFSYELCLERVKAEQIAGLDLSHWDVAFNGAEPVRADTMARFSSVFGSCGFRREAFYPCYGLAEATLMVSGGVPSHLPVIQRVQKTALAQERVVNADENHPDVDVQQFVSSGGAAPGHDIAIVDPNSGAICPADRVGEIWVSGPSIARGYWLQGEETSQTFGARLAGDSPFLRTGDLGFMQDGQLFVTGRFKDLVVVNGRNHYPPDIEKTIEQSHPSFGTNTCAVFSVDINNQERVIVLVEMLSRTTERRPNAAVATDSDGEVGRADLVRLIRRSVAEHHDLQVYGVRFVKPGSIPKTTSGKIRRHLCKTAFLAGEYPAPLS